MILGSLVLANLMDWTWIPPNHPDLQISGRVLYTAADKLQVIWPGSSIRGRFHGRSLLVQLEDGGNTDYQVIIDGDVPGSKILDTEAGYHTYPLAQDLPPGEHSFELFRRTETFSGVSQIDGFLLDASADFLPWNQPPAMRLDFYGDSQTVGACDECGPVEQWDDLRQHNHFLAYPALTSRMLNAESQITAVSGMGLTLGYQDFTMAQIWDHVWPDPQSDLYQPGVRQPDAIVVNLGQNDFSRGVGAGFGPAYAKFIRLLRQRHPKAWIIALMGSMDAAHATSPYPGYIQAAIAEQHDSKIIFHILKTKTFDHPRVAEHSEMAGELVALLRSLNLGLP